MGLDTGKAGADVEAAARGAAATEGPSWQLRHSTFRRLGERYGAHMFRPAQGATPGLPNNGIAGTATYAPPQQQPPAGSSDGKDGGDAAPWVQAADGKPAGGGEGLSVSASAGAPPYAWGGPASAWGAPPGGAALPGAAGPSGDSPSLDGLVSAGAGASGIPLPVSSPAGAALDDSMAAEAAARRSSGRRSHDGAFHVPRRRLPCRAQRLSAAATTAPSTSCSTTERGGHDGAFHVVLNDRARRPRAAAAQRLSAAAAHSSSSSSERRSSIGGAACRRRAARQSPLGGVRHARAR
eukprot:357252-Chlamydomonas_euryale.AAC.2